MPNEGNYSRFVGDAISTLPNFKLMTYEVEFRLKEPESLQSKKAREGSGSES